MTWKYSEFVFRLVEKTGCAVAVKYLLPGEELDPDSLITVSDDDDLQVCGLSRMPTHCTLLIVTTSMLVISEGLAAGIDRSGLWHPMLMVSESLMLAPSLLL